MTTSNIKIRVKSDSEGLSCWIEDKYGKSILIYMEYFLEETGKFPYRVGLDSIQNSRFYSWELSVQLTAMFPDIIFE